MAKATKPTKVDMNDYSDGDNGICLSCREIQYGCCEPDACEYECENCGEHRVYGLEEAMIMGEIEIREHD